MRSAGLVAAVALVLAGGASAQVVAPHVQDGELAVAPDGTPFVAYVRASTLRIASRAGNGRWRTRRAASVTPGSALVAFDAGRAGPVAVLLGPDERSLVLVQARRRRQLAAGLPAGVSLGWPGLALDAKGLPVIAYTRWRRSTHETVLVLARVGRRGRLSQQNVTSAGFPKSYVAPPSTPLFVGGRVHVFESYGYEVAVGTIEWRPQRHAWTGQFIDGGVVDYPVRAVPRWRPTSGSLPKRRVCPAVRSPGRERWWVTAAPSSSTAGSPTSTARHTALATCCWPGREGSP